MNGPSKLAAPISSKQFFGLKLKNTEVDSLRSENKELNENFADLSRDLEIVRLTNKFGVKEQF